METDDLLKTKRVREANLLMTECDDDKNGLLMLTEWLGYCKKSNEYDDKTYGGHCHKSKT